MKDSEYYFKNDTLGELAQSGVYIKVSTSSRAATYNIKFIGRAQGSAIELNEHIYSFIPILQTRLAYFSLKRWIM